MTTKSTPNLLHELDFGSLSSRDRKRLASVLLQMPERDEDRGARITRLREDRDLSQPQVIRGLEDQEGGHVVSLRGYQAWEAGGNIKPENLLALARFHGIDPQWIKRGDTADPLPGPTILSVEDAERLKRIEEKLDELLKRREAPEAPDHLPPAEDQPPDEPDEPESGTG